MDGTLDGRVDTRYPVDCEVWLTDLQHTGSAACGVIRDISESGLCVVTPLEFAPGDSVRMDLADSALYGFVTYSQPENAAGERHWRSGIEVQRVLVGESDLATLLKRILAEQMPQVLAETRA
jgi:hypothetical protein